MPTGDFKWLKKKEIQEIDWANLEEDLDVGYICEVTMEYPKNLHLSHNSYPLAPYHREIKGDQLSPYAKSEYLFMIKYYLIHYS